ncbi:MAG: hypothetical protein ACMG6H_14935, partial [Acidobacteriota bacterium]
LALNLPGSWFGGGATQTYPGAAMGIAAGFGQAEGEKLVITGPDSKNAVILALITPRISTREYGVITVDADGVPDNADVALFWRNDLAPTKMFTRSLTVAGGRLQDAMLAGDSNWLGRVHTVGLIVRGALAQPVTINGLALKPASAATILAERWRDWADRETWTGISLFRIVGGRAGMDLPLPLLTGLAVALACGSYWALRRWRRWPSSALTIAAILMSGWLVLDLRWQWNLGSDAIASWNNLAGKDLSSKRLADVDAEFEIVAIDVRPLLTKDARLFVFAQDPVAAGVVALARALQEGRPDAGSPQGRCPLFARAQRVFVGWPIPVARRDPLRQARNRPGASSLMLVPGLLLSIALPALAGLPWLLAAQSRRAPGGWPLAIAYGYVLGLLITIAGIRALDFAHLPINLFAEAIFPAMAAAVGWWRMRSALEFARADARAAGAAWQSMSRVTRIVCAAAVALIVLRLLTLGAEILLRPVFPWEAVSAVAAKARVWYELGELAPFVSPASWLAGLGDFTDADPAAFALPSLLLVWTAHAIGQWHEGAIGCPWWMLGLSLVLALY